MKQKINVSAVADDIEKAKELIEDLEVLNQKYDVSFSVGYETSEAERTSGEGTGINFDDNNEGYRWG